MAKKNTSVGKLYGKRKLILSLALIFGILSVIIVLVTYFGQNVGSFSIRLDGSLEERKIFASTDPEFSWYNSRLEAEPVANASTTSIRFVRHDLCRATDGNYVGSNRSYMSYTFYLKNMGNEAVDVNQVVQITNATNQLDEISWIWVFEDDSTTGDIYQKEDQNIPEDWPGYLADYPETNKFESDNVVFEKGIRNLRPNEVKKFTFIIWMESLDPNITEDKSGGSIQFNIAFSVMRDS